MPQTPPNGCPKGRPTCKGHRVFRGGGSRDGDTECIDKVTIEEFPKRIGTLMIGDQRCWYERDTEASRGATVVYQFIGFGRNGPTHGGPGKTKGQSA